jgi:hypothetical protein
MTTPEPDEPIPPEARTVSNELGHLIGIQQFVDHLGTADEIIDAPSHAAGTGGKIVRWHIYAQKWKTLEVILIEYADGKAHIAMRQKSA